MIDTQGKPVWMNDGSCKTCAEWRALVAANPGKVVCYGCKKVIVPDWEDKAKFREGGFQSVAVDHWHQTSVTGVPAYQGIQRQLCKECYAADRKTVYPNGRNPFSPDYHDGDLKTSGVPADGR